MLSYQVVFSRALAWPFMLKCVKLLGFSGIGLHYPHARLPGESHMSQQLLLFSVASQWLWKSDAISLGCSCSQAIDFLRANIYVKMISLIIFLTKNIQNWYFKPEICCVLRKYWLYPNDMGHCDIYKISRNMFSKSFSILILWKCSSNYLNS